MKKGILMRSNKNMIVFLKILLNLIFNKIMYVLYNKFLVITIENSIRRKKIGGNRSNTGKITTINWD